MITAATGEDQRYAVNSVFIFFFILGTKVEVDYCDKNIKSFLYLQSDAQLFCKCGQR